jgi:hypothetical protein
MCDVAEAGTVIVETNTDAGEVENTACESCIDTDCAIPQCDCLTDPNMVSQGGSPVPACGVYVVCLYETLLQDLATSDASASADLTAAETACAGSLPMSSLMEGDTFMGCIASNCPTQCF